MNLFRYSLYYTVAKLLINFVRGSPSATSIVQDVVPGFSRCHYAVSLKKKLTDHECCQLCLAGGEHSSTFLDNCAFNSNDELQKSLIDSTPESQKGKEGTKTSPRWLGQEFISFPGGVPQVLPVTLSYLPLGEGQNNIAGPMGQIKPNCQGQNAPVPPLGPLFPNQPQMNPPPGLFFPNQPQQNPPAGPLFPNQHQMNPPPGLFFPNQPQMNPPPGLFFPNQPQMNPPPGMFFQSQEHFQNNQEGINSSQILQQNSQGCIDGQPLNPTDAQINHPMQNFFPLPQGENFLQLNPYAPNLFQAQDQNLYSTLPPTKGIENMDTNQFWAFQNSAATDGQLYNFFQDTSSRSNDESSFRVQNKMNEQQDDPLNQPDYSNDMNEKINVSPSQINYNTNEEKIKGNRDDFKVELSASDSEKQAQQPDNNQDPKEINPDRPVDFKHEGFSSFFNWNLNQQNFEQNGFSFTNSRNDYVHPQNVLPLNPTRNAVDTEEKVSDESETKNYLDNSKSFRKELNFDTSSLTTTPNVFESEKKNENLFFSNRDTNAGNLILNVEEPCPFETAYSGKMHSVITHKTEEKEKDMIQHAESDITTGPAEEKKEELEETEKDTSVDASKYSSNEQQAEINESKQSVSGHTAFDGDDFTSRTDLPEEEAVSTTESSNPDNSSGGEVETLNTDLPREEKDIKTEPKDQKTKTNKGLIFGAVGGALGAVLGLAGAGGYVYMKKRNEATVPEFDVESVGSEVMDDKDVAIHVPGTYFE